MSIVVLILGLVAGYGFGRAQHHKWMAKNFRDLADIERRRGVTVKDMLAAFGRKYPR